MKISLNDVKIALLDERFRNTLPEALLPDVQKFLSNPGCGCNHPIYKKILKLANKQLVAYYPNKEVVEDLPTPENDWEVINCSIIDLQKRLSSLKIGRKQIEMARWQEQVTVIINHLAD